MPNTYPAMASFCDACGATVPGSREDFSSIDEAESPFSNDSFSTTTHPSSISVSAHYDDFKDFAEEANCALQGAFPVHLRSRDSKVGVLLLSFEDDDLGVAEEIEELHKVFEKDYGYKPEPWPIPKVDSQKELSNKLYDFRASYCHQGLEENDTLPLLIVYYAGHAAKPSRGEITCLWAR